VPDDDGQVDRESASTHVREASGIIVGGGDTPTYQRLYATEPLRTVIRDRCLDGVPYAGLSAGALIACDPCVRLPREPTGGRITILPGLGLLQGLLVGVHFNRPGRLPYLLEAMRETGIRIALGIDEAACVVVEDGKPKRVLGSSAYEITLEDAATGRHSVSKLSDR
jgi:cyanophycinase